MKDFTAARRRMVETQLRTRGITDGRVLEAMGEVPRHLFVQPPLQAEAYDDNPLPIGHGQTISQPYMVAVMTELLLLEGSERVLEVGTGSGYQAAVLSRLCKWVYTIEAVEVLSVGARKTLTECGYDNITFRVGDGSSGWPEEAPFDAIMVTAGAPRVPDILVNQLVPGGILVIPVGDRFSQTLKRVIADKSGAKVERYTGCRFVDLIGEFGWKK
ncbi:MAG: protein-L-isoaspartate(D-aspartate) O-methyltransferase [Pseudomonadota bacterium]